MMFPLFPAGSSSSSGGSSIGSSSEVQWCFSQVKGTLDDDVTEADIISCVEFNQDGDLLATGDKGGRVVIFQRDPASKSSMPRRGEYNVYSTFQSHEPEFDYLKSLEIEEKINKIRWLKRKNPAHFLLSTNGERKWKGNWGHLSGQFPSILQTRPSSCGRSLSATEGPRDTISRRTTGCSGIREQ